MSQTINNFLCITVMISLFVIYYLILSLIPLLFGCTYYEVISNLNWGVLYSMLIGWWLVWLTIDTDVKL